MADAQDRGWGPPCPSSEITTIQAGGRSFNVHRKVAKIFTNFITTLVATPYPIDKGTLDDWSYNCRHISNDPSKPWSNHAWGLAVDINSLTNPMTSPLTTDMPGWVRDEQKLMDTWGLRWGGEYSGTPDPMHYEFMLTPADADRISASLDGGEWWEVGAIPPAQVDQIVSACLKALDQWDSARPPYLGSNPDGSKKSATLTEAVNGIWGGGIPLISTNVKELLAWTTATNLPTADEIADAVWADVPPGAGVDYLTVKRACTAALEEVIARITVDVEPDPTGRGVAVEAEVEGRRE